jgi:3-methyladenine DNA glycosylase AlkD
LAEKLKNHPHDLMHKAIGWMLREVGNRNFEVANEFLIKHYRNLPRTLLRYAIERFPEELRQDYLKGRV